MVGLGRLELPTSRLSGVRSNHLSYRPFFANTQIAEGNQFGLSTNVRPRGPLPEAHPIERETKTATSRFVMRPRIYRVYVLKISDGWSDKFIVITYVTIMSQAPQGKFLRKEVIQPQVPLRLPCYDFTPVANPTVVGCLLKG